MNSRKGMNEPGIETATSCSQVLCAIDLATRARQDENNNKQFSSNVHFNPLPHNVAPKIYSGGKHHEKKRNCL